MLLFLFGVLTMTNTKDFTDKRKHKRFKAKKGAFAILRSDQNKLGQIKDISQGGLSFQYDTSGEQFDGSAEMDILLPGNNFYLKNVPVRKVVDFEVNNKVSFSSLPLRQRNMEFGEMKPIQIFQLYYFIQHHTIDEF
jgi:hypothetical protein